MPNSEAPKASVVSGTQTIQRAAAILRLLTANNRAGMRLTDIYVAEGLERSTAHRILQGLIAEQLVSQHPQSKRYFLGSSVYEMGLAAAPSFQLRDVCHPYVREIAEETGDTVFLVRRSGFSGVCIDRAEGSFPIRVFVMEVGRPRPLNVGGCNICILSTLSDEEVKRICQVNSTAVAEHYPKYSDTVLWKRIMEVRTRGFMVNEIIEVPNARAVAVPIRGAAGGAAIAGISVSAVASRLGHSRANQVSNLLLATVKRIEAEIAALQT